MVYQVFITNSGSLYGIIIHYHKPVWWENSGVDIAMQYRVALFAYLYRATRFFHIKLAIKLSALVRVHPDIFVIYPDKAMAKDFMVDVIIAYCF
jgi:hypothetical protein